MSRDAPKFPEYFDYSVRVESFRGGIIADGQTAEGLADAGWFYVGKTICKTPIGGATERGYILSGICIKPSRNWGGGVAWSKRMCEEFLDDPFFISETFLVRMLVSPPIPEPGYATGKFATN